MIKLKNDVFEIEASIALDNDHLGRQQFSFPGAGGANANKFVAPSSFIFQQVSSTDTTKGGYKAYMIPQIASTDPKSRQMVFRTLDFATMQITEYQSTNQGVQAYFSSLVYLDGFLYLGGTQGVDSTNPQASLATLSKIKAANSGPSLITDFVWFYRMSA